MVWPQVVPGADEPLNKGRDVLVQRISAAGQIVWEEGGARRSKAGAGAAVSPI